MPDPDAPSGGDPRQTEDKPPRPATPQPQYPGQGTQPATQAPSQNTDPAIESSDTPVANWAAMGLSETSQSRQFYYEEWNAARARGQGNPFSGWKLPKGDAGDFWQVYSMAEQFAANTGWRYLADPRTIQYMVENGFGSKDALDVFAYLSQKMGLDSKMPWAATGMSHTQYDQSSRNLDNTILDLTGQAGWDAAGLDPDLRRQALLYGWDASALKTHLLNNTNAVSQYGWLKYNMNYNDFQNYKTQNADKLKSRFGSGYTTTQVLTDLGAPLTAFGASASAFGEQQTPAMFGRQSQVR